MKQNALVLLSGGVDSMACCHFFMEQGFKVNAVFVNYGQRALNYETESARAVANHLKIDLQEIEITGLIQDDDAEIIGRNMLLLSISILTMQTKTGLIALAVHTGTPYFDCSEQFIQLTNKLVREQTDGALSISAPFVSWSKQEIYTYVKTNALPIELTYSCEAGTDPPCGNCLSCRDRTLW